MSTSNCAVQSLEAGDEYVIRVLHSGLESRTVLEVLQHSPMGGALLWVRDDSGNAFRSHMSGSVDVVARA